MTCGLKWFTPHEVPHECQRPEGHSGIHSCQCGEGLWPHEVDDPAHIDGYRDHSEAETTNND